MRGGALPPTLLMAALALALSRSARWDRAPAVALCLLAGVALCAYPAPPSWTEAIFLGGWTSLALTAALTHWPGGPGRILSMTAGLNAGVWSGLLVGRAGRPLDLVTAASGLLLLLPGAWLARRRWTIALKVTASWLIAIAVLASVLPLIPTPGYAPDHMN
jgi:hypothetical protein